MAISPRDICLVCYINNSTYQCRLLRWLVSCVGVGVGLYALAIVVEPLLVAPLIGNHYRVATTRAEPPQNQSCKHQSEPQLQGVNMSNGLSLDCRATFDLGLNDEVGASGG